MRITLPKTFSQNDPRWKNSQLGNSGTIGAYGCLENDATMVADYYGADETPLTLNQKLFDNGGYVNSKGEPTPKASGANLFVWGVFAKLFNLKYSGQFSNSSALTKSQMDQIRGAIDKGYPVFLQIDTVPSTSALDEHWILAVDYDGDDFVIQDPWDGATKKITSWGVQPQKLIYAWCWFEGNVPSKQEQQNAQTITIPVVERDFLVSRATVAKEVATYMGIDDPDNAPADRYKRSIDGLKSATTAVQSKLDDSEKALDEAKTEIQNQKDKVANTEAKCQRDLEAQKVQFDALKASVPDMQKLEGQYKGRIDVLEEQVRDLQKSGGEKDITISNLQTRIKQLQKGQVASLSFGDLVSLLLAKIK